jgi:DNA-binding GntR family transcriptional regulator
MATTLTTFILRDLKERLQVDDAPTPELTLGQLAAHYGVSLTPVRLAVDVLVEEGVLLRRENGRLAVNPDKVPQTPLLPMEAESFEVRPDWEARLVEAILAKSLQGATDYLREEAVAKRYGVGRTVIRQAFSRLAGKGLLEHVPRCGWRVRIFDERDMRDYLVVREAMERTALDLARPRLAAADLERMLWANTPPHPGAPAPLDNSLHRYWIERSENAYIRDFFDRHGLYYSALFDFAAPEAHQMEEMAAQHRAILTALLEENWERAKEELTGHIRSQYPVVTRLMKQLATRGES